MHIWFFLSIPVPFHDTPNLHGVKWSNQATRNATNCPFQSAAMMSKGWRETRHVATLPQRRIHASFMFQKLLNCQAVSAKFLTRVSCKLYEETHREDDLFLLHCKFQAHMRQSEQLSTDETREKFMVKEYESKLPLSHRF